LQEPTYIVRGVIDEGEKFYDNDFRAFNENPPFRRRHRRIADGGANPVGVNVAKLF
jgi:hypothetical protein